MTLPAALERFSAQLGAATRTQARRRARRRRARILVAALALLGVLGSAAVAGGWLGGKPAPDAVKLALQRELRASSAQVESLVGAPIPGEAIVAASLDAHHYVWGAPTTTGGYCVGLTGPRAVVDGDSCSGASAGTWSSYYDCDGSVIVGGRIAGIARPRARWFEIRHDGRTLALPLPPSQHGFFIARLPASLFRDVTPHNRPTWPRTAVLDARRHVVPPSSVNSGFLPPPDHPLCSLPTP